MSLNIRVLDIVFSIFGLIILSPVILVCVIVVFLSGFENPIFVQNRLGFRKRVFKIYKIRTMISSTPDVATHEVNANNVTTFGRFLRKFKIDELPQLFNVLIGDMSLVGPRPCLSSQIEVIEAREKLNVFRVKPGITGWSQIKEVDMSNPKKLSELDHLMISSFTTKEYLGIILKTLKGSGISDRIK